ncbi:polysaccharide deacetylase family protein [Paenibacillus sp. FSL H7-0331]|uniref:polysaccharide deacetylase family protein n=1 Tax=Paenibacillus sp. FSL H7-0331 TaxID=1920421 RepID=UPI00096CB209|nr:polysaccharide deacetylase family protein [Paenibacillus sp. FSL H7-0331]OMF16186.1 hypothetical protein BK127_12145 [Paenibacillus sp. FSL H7-0331]
MKYLIYMIIAALFMMICVFTLQIGGKGVAALLLPPSPAAAAVTSSDKIAYLTFDDGPSQSTSRILDILQKDGIKATFFVTGKTSDYSKQMLHRIVDEGHTLGNHTYSHDYKRIYASVGAFKADVDRLNRFLEETVGVKPNILRYPGGSNNHLSWRSGGRHIMSAITREMSALGYQYFDWNVSSTDAAAVTQSKEAIVESVKSNSSGKKQIIVLMHDMDVKTTTVEALPEIISYLQQSGYHFDVLGKDSYTFQFLRPGKS